MMGVAVGLDSTLAVPTAVHRVADCLIEYAWRTEVIEMLRSRHRGVDHLVRDLVSAVMPIEVGIDDAAALGQWSAVALRSGAALHSAKMVVLRVGGWPVLWWGRPSSLVRQLSFSLFGHEKAPRAARGIVEVLLRCRRGYAPLASRLSSHESTTDFFHTRLRPNLNEGGPEPMCAQYRHVEAGVPVSSSSWVLSR
jgi:hypothetical protein